MNPAHEDRFTALQNNINNLTNIFYATQDDKHHMHLEMKKMIIEHQKKFEALTVRGYIIVALLSTITLINIFI